MNTRNQHLGRSLPLAAAVALGFAAAAAAQQPTGQQGGQQNPAADPGGAVNDPARNQAQNPADAGETGSTGSRVPVAEPYLPLTIDRFNHLDEDQDGALSEAELAEDATLEDRFEEMDVDRNREIDDAEFRGYQPTRPAGESSDDLTGARKLDTDSLDFSEAVPLQATGEPREENRASQPIEDEPRPG